MSLKAWLKSRAADRVLLPLRQELIGLIDKDASLLEIGCGTGDLLFQAASKISNGYGIDIDKAMIEFAEARRREHQFDQLRFECIDALLMTPQPFDFSTSTLCLHEMPEPVACELLKMMVNCSKTVLIADYSRTERAFSRISIELDELFSGHFRNYRRYRKNGEIPYYADKIGATIRQQAVSTIDGVSIWSIKGKDIAS